MPDLCDLSEQLSWDDVMEILARKTCGELWQIRESQMKDPEYEESGYRVMILASLSDAEIFAEEAYNLALDKFEDQRGFLEKLGEKFDLVANELIA